MYLKITLWMIAGRAYIRCCGANYDMSAVAAFPYLDLALSKYGGGLHVL